MTEVVGSRIGPTLLLFGLGEMIAIVVGLALGAYAGWRRGGAVDLVGNGVSLILYSMPYFLLGMILLLVFASTLHWFPSFGMTTLGVARFAARLPGRPVGHLMPVATVALGLIGQYSILMRSSIIRRCRTNTSRRRGRRDAEDAHPARPRASERDVAHRLADRRQPRLRRGRRDAIEVVFNWPGLGTLTVEALTSRDYPVLQGIFLVLDISVCSQVSGLQHDHGRLVEDVQGMTTPAATIDAGTLARPDRLALLVAWSRARTGCSGSSSRSSSCSRRCSSWSGRSRRPRPRPRPP